MTGIHICKSFSLPIEALTIKRPDSLQHRCCSVKLLRLPCDILFVRPSDTPSSPNEYLNNLEAHLESVHAFARERIKLASERTKTRCYYGATDHHFNVDDQV
ncbi:hypothetical protein AVEN_197418-1 [Araneus ventricosus]|uniref:Uncharacterized protein n=1 Tax=Araneus ventricosus TaxID=182803 RepID=A0A4Y2IBX7_ARAVE|nr:hypothetical protein AVEN_197418-1 [Araneus ventricosus]